MKKILFINYCIYLPGEKALKRTFYLFDMMLKQGYDVTFLTSDFNHYEKKIRDINVFYNNFPEYRDNVKFVHMKPYEKNISVKRYINNYLCEKKLLKWFIKYGRKFDVVYISWPMYDLVNKIHEYCDLYNVKMILDINDLWPDSLKMVIKNDIVYNCLTYFLQNKTKEAFSYADGIIAVSNEYLNKAISFNNKSIFNKTVYIGAMIDYFDEGVSKYKDEIEKVNDEFWLIYIGTLGKSYDLDTIVLAVDKLRNLGYNIRFKILGQGPSEYKLKQLTKKIECDGIDFIGFTDYAKMAAYLSKSDVCMNSIKQRATQSIINKVADYFASGNPVLNCGSCKEMQSLISDYNTGINYIAENVESLCEAILCLLSDKNKAKEKGRNARKLAQKKFDRKRTHNELIKDIEEYYLK